jgi:hypothetical protein
MVRLSALWKGPDITIAETRTDSAGRFTVAIPTSKRLLQLASENSNYLNLQIMAVGSSESEPPPEDASVESERQTSLLNANAALANASYSGTSTFIALMAASTQVIHSPDSGTAAAFLAPNVALLTARSASPNGTTPCGPREYFWSDWERIGRTWEYEPVIEFHAYWDVKGEYEYGKSADSSIGVVYGYSGANWKVSGSVKTANYEGQLIRSGLVGPYYGRRITQKFEFWKERSTYSYERGCYVDRIRAIEWFAEGVTPYYDTRSRDGYDQFAYWQDRCTDGAGCISPWGPGQYFERESASGATYTTGVSAFGVGTQIVSGYSTRAKIYWQFGKSPYTHYLFSNRHPTRATVVYSW